MIKFNNDKISVYKGAYKPVDIQKNAVKLGGFSVGTTDAAKFAFDGSYDNCLTVLGKSERIKSQNLCPNLKAQSGSLNEYSWQITPNSDGTFDFSGAMLTGVTVGGVTLPAGTYTASGAKLIQLYWDGLDGFLTLPATFTLEKETAVLLVMWYTETTEISLKNQYIQIEKGSVATQFCPFAGDENSMPSPQNYRPIASAKATIFCDGKNLANADLMPGFIKQSDGSYVSTEKVTTASKIQVDLPEGIYTLSCSIKSPNDKHYRLIIYYADGTSYSKFVSSTGDFVEGVLTTDGRAVSAIGLIYTSTSNNVEFKELMLEKGEVKTDYHPYFYSTHYSMPLLRCLEVTKNTAHNYIETASTQNKYYLCDFLKGQTLTQNIGAIEFTGNENWCKEDVENSEFSLFSLCIEDAAPQNICMCSHFQNVSEVSNSTTYAAIVNDVLSTNNFKFWVPKTVASTLTEWKNWLLEQSKSANPVMVQYLLNSPKTQTLDDVTIIKSVPRKTVINQQSTGSNLYYRIRYLFSK